MRRTIATLAAIFVAVALSACEPPSVTGAPSTLRPGCTEIVYVTGLGKPAAEIRNVVLEYQSGSTWRTYYWFPDGTSPKKEIRKSVAADGTYTMQFYRPQLNTATIRFRVRGMKLLSDPGVVSKSFYVTPPKSDDC